MINKSKLRIKTISLLKFFAGIDFVQFLLCKKYINFYKKQDTIFIHIPKAAGTSISNELYGKRNGHLRALFVKNKLGDEFTNKYSFSVSRNPYDRLYSAYRFAIQGETKDGAIANSSFYQQDMFASFESFVNNWLVYQNLDNLDPVFQPQYLYVFNEEFELIIDDLFKLEDLNNVEEVLSNKLNKSIKFKKSNVSQKQSNRKEVYTKSLKEKVFKLYKNDFQLLGYEK